jgi:D-arginine dehydrogenase
MAYDFIVIGAGIAGASAAYELSRAGRTLLLEREERPAYHTTGRSAAFFTLNYGNRVIRSLTATSEAFFSDPPDGFAATPLMRRHAIVTIAREDQRAEFARNLATARATGCDIEELTPEQAERLVPVLRPGYAAFAHLERDAYHMDVDLILGGFLRGLAARGGTLACDAEVEALAREAGVWRVTTRAGGFEAPVVVDAAGAWADDVARLAGLAPVGLEPFRRTVIIFPEPDGVSLAGCPLVIDADERFYFKPDAGKVLASPADETLSPPCDAQPEEIDVAITVERIERATTMRIERIDHKWAGLRSFVADRAPVVGIDPEAEGFVWLAGQGGYGIMTSPAMARIAVALAGAGAWPDDIAALGVRAGDLAPRRRALARAAGAPTDSRTSAR